MQDIRLLYVEWLDSQTAITRKSYQQRINFLIKSGLLDLKAARGFNYIIDMIFKKKDYSLSYRRGIIHTLVSLSKFVNRRTDGAFPVACADPSAFREVQRKVASTALTEAQIDVLFKELKRLSLKSYAIAALCLCGARRISEVINILDTDIKWESNQIAFNQSKTREINGKVCVTFSKNILDVLRTLIGNRTGRVFVSRYNNPLSVGQFDNDLKKAAAMAGIEESVSSHDLRTSAITLWMQKYSPHDILRVTGHSSIRQLLRYDKTSQENNLTKFDDTLNYIYN